MSRRASAAVTVLLLLLAAPLAALEVPYLSGRVNDNADLVPDDVQQRIEQKLAGFEQKTGNQIAVLTVESLEGEAVEDYTLRVAETWKLGQQGKDNGILFLISEQDRRMRIEVGYGLEAELTDLESNRIMDNVVRPYFRNGDFGGGVEKGVDAIVASLQGEEITPAPGADSTAPQMTASQKGMFGLIFFLVIGLFSLTAVVSDGCQSWFLYVFLMPFYATFPNMIFPGLGIGALIAWAVGFPILKALLGKRGGGGGGPFGGRRGGGWFSPIIIGSGGWGGGGGGGWGGGGGFSGGGGSFGGGGSSGSW